MGRGLGKLQKAILDYLHAEGKPCWASSIAYSLYYARDDVRECDPLPRSFEVSVRRAIHALAKRELVCTGTRADPRRLIGDPIPSLVCWLPGQSPPRLDTIIHGADVDRLVLAALAKAEVETDPFEQRFFFGRQPAHLIGTGQQFVQYSWLTNHVVKALGGNMIEGKRAVAIHRSVKRLAAQGRIKAYWKSSRGHYGWVKLNES